MVFRDIFIWWYTTGLHQRIVAMTERLDGVADYFSIGLLLKTLFAPFRQIAAGQVDGPLEVQLRAMLDRVLSRVIGAATRLIVMCVGATWLICTFTAGLLYIVVWVMLPALPLIGLGLFIGGWVPWSL